MWDSISDGWNGENGTKIINIYDKKIFRTEACQSFEWMDPLRDQWNE